MDTFETNPVVARPAKRSWRRHSDQFKARVIELARQADSSVAAVALANGLNANMLRRWVREHEQSRAVKAAPSVPTAAFVQLPVSFAPEPTVVPPAGGRIQLQIHRGDIRVDMSLPLEAGSAVWLREVLG